MWAVHISKVVWDCLKRALLHITVTSTQVMWIICLTPAYKKHSGLHLGSFCKWHDSIFLPRDCTYSSLWHITGYCTQVMWLCFGSCQQKALLTYHLGSEPRWCFSTVASPWSQRRLWHIVKPLVRWCYFHTFVLHIVAIVIYFYGMLLGPQPWWYNSLACAGETKKKWHCDILLGTTTKLSCPPDKLFSYKCDCEIYIAWIQKHANQT